MIHVRSQDEIGQMRAAGALSKAALRLAGSVARPGVSTLELDRAVEGFIRMHDAAPAFKGEGFPASVCTSVNEQVVHGIPSSAVVLREGDVVSVDTGAAKGGWVGDNAWTFLVGAVDPEVRALCACALDCLKAGIAAAVPGNHVGDVGAAVQRLAEDSGYSVVRGYVGHGVGHALHEDPDVPNWGRPGRGVRLQAGMVIAIEPMICLGGYDTRVLANGWTVVTSDGRPAAHYENTVAVTDDGPVVLTADDEGPWCPLAAGGAT